MFLAWRLGGDFPTREGGTKQRSKSAVATKKSSSLPNLKPTLTSCEYCQMRRASQASRHPLSPFPINLIIIPSSQGYIRASSKRISAHLAISLLHFASPLEESWGEKYLLSRDLRALAPRPRFRSWSIATRPSWLGVGFFFFSSNK